MRTSKRKECKKETPKKLEENSVFARIGKGKCHCCGETNHEDHADCTKCLSAPKSEWHINKNKEVQAHQQLAEEIAGVMHAQCDTAANSGSQDTSTVRHWTPLHHPKRGGTYFISFAAHSAMTT